MVKYNPSLMMLFTTQLVFSYSKLRANINCISKLHILHFINGEIGMVF
jgi:hypothetical protein